MNVAKAAQYHATTMFWLGFGFFPVSDDSLASCVTCFKSMRHLEHLPGLSITISGCIGQLYIDFSLCIFILCILVSCANTETERMVKAAIISILIDFMLLILLFMKNKLQRKALTEMPKARQMFARLI